MVDGCGGPGHPRAGGAVTMRSEVVVKVSWMLWGSWAWKPFHGLRFLFVGNRRHSPS